MQCGLKPDEVLNMSMDMFQSCLQGYSDLLFDQQLLGLQSGYWAGYYGNPNMKRPKPLKQIIQMLVRNKEKADKQLKGAVINKPEVNVDAYLELERQFHERAAQQPVKRNVVK